MKVREGVFALAMLGLAAASGHAAPSCPAPLGFDARARLESRDVVVLYRTVPDIEVGRHFAVEAVICAEPPAAVTTVRIDAQMPEHRHGMNYRPRVFPRGDGLYVAEGLLFHMPGRWQLLFDVERGAGWSAWRPRSTSNERAGSHRGIAVSVLAALAAGAMLLDSRGRRRAPPARAPQRCRPRKASISRPERSGEFSRTAGGRSARSAIRAIACRAFRPPSPWGSGSSSSAGCL